MCFKRASLTLDSQPTGNRHWSSCLISFSGNNAVSILTLRIGSGHHRAWVSGSGEPWVSSGATPFSLSLPAWSFCMTQIHHVLTMCTFSKQWRQIIYNLVICKHQHKMIMAELGRELAYFVLPCIEDCLLHPLRILDYLQTQRVTGARSNFHSEYWYKTKLPKNMYSNFRDTQHCANSGVEEMTQWLTAQAAVPEHQTLVPSTHKSRCMASASTHTQMAYTKRHTYT